MEGEYYRNALAASTNFALFKYRLKEESLKASGGLSPGIMLFLYRAAIFMWRSVLGAPIRDLRGMRYPFE